MGNQNSTPFKRISRVIPQVQEAGWEDTKWVDKSFKAFRNDQDREQFIYSLLSLVSNNGKTTLDELEYKLLFSRKPNDRIVATLVAIRAGVIEAKIEPREDGASQADAFRAFKKHVESSLHELLETVPHAASLPGSPNPLAVVRSPSASGSAVRSPNVPDLPPAYETTNVRVNTGGKKG